MIPADQRLREGSGTCLQDNRAVGNSRLAHTDVLSVSCKQVPEPDRRHCLNREQGSLLHDRAGAASATLLNSQTDRELLRHACYSDARNEAG